MSLLVDLYGSQIGRLPDVSVLTRQSKPSTQAPPSVQAGSADLPAEHSVDMNWPTLGKPPSRGPSLGLWLVAGLTLGVLAAVLFSTLIAIPVTGVALGIGRWLTQREQNRKARQREEAVAQLCAIVAGQVQAGQLALRALEVAYSYGGQLAELLAPAVSAQRWSAEVPKALAAVSGWPGAEAMQAVAACWHQSQQQGVGLAQALLRVEHMVRQTQRLRQEISTQTSGPLATAWALLALPILPLAMGQAAGANPVQVLTRTRLGAICLLLGMGLCALGLWLAQRLGKNLQQQVDCGQQACTQALAHTLAACLQTGSTLDSAIVAALPVVQDKQLRAGLDGYLRWRGWGAPVLQAVHPLLELPCARQLAQLICRAQQAELHIGQALLAYADRIDLQQQSQLRRRAQMLPIKLVGLLGLCFMPAFFLLGILPLVVGLTGVIMPVFAG